MLAEMMSECCFMISMGCASLSFMSCKLWITFGMKFFASANACLVILIYFSLDLGSFPFILLAGLLGVSGKL